VFQIQLRAGYSLTELKADLAVLYLKAGLKNIGLTFLMSDSQVAEEKFLVVVNDFLASGEIMELLADDQVDNVVNAVRNEVHGYSGDKCSEILRYYNLVTYKLVTLLSCDRQVKQMGIMDTKENCWKFFIDRVRTQLRFLLSFSPVGITLRRRARQFPAIVNCTVINWFHDWPQKALESVSARFLEVQQVFFLFLLGHLVTEMFLFMHQELKELPDKYKTSVSLFMSFVHTSVNNVSGIYLENERKYNYTTPKSFLEQISLYSKLLIEKTYDLEAMILRLTDGLVKLETCASQVLNISSLVF